MLRSTSPAVSSGRSAGSFPEQRLVIEPTDRLDGNENSMFRRPLGLLEENFNRPDS